ncbi:uncharacterized protein (UPF0147 family) [Acetoanaerobium pronyense]|uniref:Uncharacterized protein (UPF0147 family) n=1 Tax=Acetoanaerobium pronyense TaxID=1482736 RepID=A0ABS4KHX4_9FIRM|nr:hypothetical protein [Acetoanaerobium pronyense]MBP2027388.1 uncharacterized protein (UPF0147 family) [Acetoanaerobium pronyense]
MFNRNSIIVKTWVSLVMMGIYKDTEVPRLFNLRDVVQEIFAEIV